MSRKTSQSFLVGDFLLIIIGLLIIFDMIVITFLIGLLGLILRLAFIASQ